ncbi:MAG: hypothetical protein JO332_19620 [Planctomycetaceae bacterium]|nr:hypothetical protein [Planctomycetaceae bacterium]
MDRDDFALDGLLRELARDQARDEAFLRRVLAGSRRRPSRRAYFFVAAAGLFAAVGFFLDPTPDARLGFRPQACLVPEAKTIRLISKGELLGEVPIDAQVRVPSGTPILLQAVGADGLALWTDRREVRLRPRENRAVPGAPAAALHPTSVSYRRDVQPILDAHCVQCHAEEELLANAKPYSARQSALVTQTHRLLASSDRRQLALWVDLGAERP